MPKYLCLGYYDADRFDHVTPEQMAAIAETCRPHDEKFVASGQVKLIASLEHRVSRTIRPKPGGPAIHDGPFAEAKEVIGSIFIVEAEDLHDAVRVASLHPAGQWGEHLGFAIEVRPIDYYQPY